jgi:hypothetical protein
VHLAAIERSLVGVDLDQGAAVYRDGIHLWPGAVRERHCYRTVLAPFNAQIDCKLGPNLPLGAHLFIGPARTNHGRRRYEIASKGIPKRRLGVDRERSDTACFDAKRVGAVAGISAAERRRSKTGSMRAACASGRGVRAERS